LDPVAKRALPLDGRSLIGRVVRLDKATPADAPALFAALDDERVYRYGYGGGLAGRPSSPESIARAIAATATDPSRTQYVVRLADGAIGSEGTVIGTTTLGDAVPEHGRIHIGWTGYAPSVWGTAVNPECKLLLLELAFDGLGYGRVKIQTDLINQRSQAAIEKLGAVREGVLRHHQIRADGSWRDTVVFSILAEEWPAVRGRLESRIGDWLSRTTPRENPHIAARTVAADPLAVVLQGALRASIARRAERVGPFLILFDPASDIPSRNYAIPDDNTMPTPDETAALVAAFRAQGRQPRLEIVVPAPGAQRALAEAGFIKERHLPLMVHDPADDVGAEPGDTSFGDVAAALVTTDEELRQAADIQHVAYGGEGHAETSDVDRLARTIRAGGGVALAWLHGAPVGSGVFTPPANGFSEVAAVGVLPPSRRRGVATSVVVALTAGVQAAGARPFLQAENTDTARIYQRAGYRVVGELAMVSLPS
jgi:RimJ/RimL family protein N-acetyltransferase